MSLPIRAYILLRYGNDWSVEVCRDFEAVLSHWHARKTPEVTTGVLHLGFHRPPTHSFSDVTQNYPGRLLLTASAKYGVPPDYTTTNRPVGYVDYLPVFLGVLGWGYVLDDDQTQMSGDLIISSPILVSEPEGWIKAFLEMNGDFKDAFRSAEVYDETSYLLNEGYLSRDLRYRSGIFRYRKLIGSDDSDPCAVARAAPPWLQERTFESIEISVRVANVFTNQNLKRVGELANLDVFDLLRFGNFGRKSVGDLLRSLIQALQEGPLLDHFDKPEEIASSVGRQEINSLEPEAAAARRVWDQGFLRGFQETFTALFQRDGDVLSRRMGLYGPVETLQEIADDYDLTRERIRQIENRAIGRLAKNPDLKMLLTSKLEVLLSERRFPLPLLGVEAVDRWFLGLSKSSTALPYVLENIGMGCFGTTRIDGVDYLGFLNQQKWDEALFEGRRILESGVGHAWSEENCRALAGC